MTCTPPQIGEFCWNELATANVEAAKDFYGKVFGWEFSDYPIGDMTYTLIKQNKKDIAGIWAIPTDMQKQIPPHWMAYILVESVEASLKKATQHGGKIIKPTTSAGDFGIFGVITDPTGAHVALWQKTDTK